MKHTSIYQRILSLAVCLTIVFTGSVTAIALDSSMGLDERNYNEDSVPVGADTHSEDEETPWWYCSNCGLGVVYTICVNSNVLVDSYTHQYGSNQRCTIEQYASKYYYKCDMSPWTGCPIIVETYFHDCYIKHLSCGKGIEVFCILAD